MQLLMTSSNHFFQRAAFSKFLKELVDMMVVNVDKKALGDPCGSTTVRHRAGLTQEDPREAPASRARKGAGPGTPPHKAHS